MLDSRFLPLWGERVGLRPLEARDAAAYAEGAADPEVRRYGHLPEPEYTSESVLLMIEREATPGLQRGELAVLAIADAGTDAFSGSLVMFDVSRHGAEVGFWVHPKCRGSGLAAAAIDLAARFARLNGLRELTARTLPHNLTSQRTLASTGFRLDHRGIGSAPSGDQVELLQYSLMLSDPYSS